MGLGKLQQTETKQRECLDMQRAIYGRDVNHHAIAASLSNLDKIYQLLGMLGEAETKQRDCLIMERLIFGHDVNRASIANTLKKSRLHLSRCRKVGRGRKDATWDFECLEMQRAVYGHGENHPDIA